jgi:predicted aspartyl protease
VLYASLLRIGDFPSLGPRGWLEGASWRKITVGRRQGMSARSAALKGQAMGRFSVELEVINHQDQIAQRLGFLAGDKVRRTKLSGVVDTGATRLVLPEKIVSLLGLPKTGKAGVRFADGRRDEKDVAGDAEVEIQGRSGVFSAIVEPGRSDALIGAIVLEELDFIADCITQSLVPRDPKQPIAEIE